MFSGKLKTINMDHNSSGVGANKIRSKKQLTIDVAAFRLDNVSVGKIVDLPSIIYVDGQVDGRL